MEKFHQEHVLIHRSPQDSWKRGIQYSVQMLESEIDDFGNLLMNHYPTGVIFARKYYGGSPAWANIKSVEFERTLSAAAADGKSSSAYFRVPWQQDVESGDSIRMLGGMEQSVLSDRLGFRQIGRCIAIRWDTPSPPTMKLALEKAKHKVDKDCAVQIVRSTLAVNAIYNQEDVEVVRFLKHVEALLIQSTTCDFASYAPHNGALISANRRNAFFRRSEGVARYVSLNEQTYFGFCSKRDAKCQVMGPRPEIRAAFRREAGLEA